MSTETPIDEFEQDPADVLDYAVGFADMCVRYREPDTAYAANVCVRPARSTGLQYKATTAGRSGNQEPRWPEVAGQTVQDGSVVWTAEAITTSSLLRTLSSATWTPDAGLTASAPAIDAEACAAVANISGGALGQSYLVRVAATFSDGKTRNRCFGLRIARPSKPAP